MLEGTRRWETLMSLFLTFQMFHILDTLFFSTFIQHHIIIVVLNIFLSLYKTFFFFLVEKWEPANKQKEDNTFHPSIQHRVLGIEAINKYLLIECQELAPWPLGKLLKLSYSICKKGWLAGLLCYLFPYVIDLFDISHLSGTWWKVLNKSYLYYYLWGRNYLKFAVSKYLTAVCHKKENDLLAI